MLLTGTQYMFHPHTNSSSAYFQCMATSPFFKKATVTIWIKQQFHIYSIIYHAYFASVHAALFASEQHPYITFFFLKFSILFCDLHIVQAQLLTGIQSTETSCI